MKKQLKITFLCLCFSFLAENLQAASLDEIYRDIVRSDNQGYLPMFVKNRNAPDFLFDEEVPAPEESRINTDGLTEVDFVNRRKIKVSAQELAAKKWQDTILAVQENRVTPVELAEIEKRLTQKDPKATEIYAWMNAKGIGVKQDLVQAFIYYKKAAYLKVPQAEQNAILVYKSLNFSQKEKIKSLPDILN